MARKTSRKSAKAKAAKKAPAKRSIKGPRKTASKNTPLIPAKAGTQTDRETETGAPRHGLKAPKLLSGGNPQIAKGYGEVPVKAYIAAMPGWKKEVGRRLDALIERAVPGVKKAVKWNSPFYGVEEGSWFLSFHVFARYVKVTFFRGAALRPRPPGESKHKDVGYYDIHEGALDEAQFSDWVKQASRLPGERM